MSNYCVIGSGRQGTSTAYDIIKNLSPSRLDLIDSNQENLDSCYKKLTSLTDFKSITLNCIDISDKDSLSSILYDVDIFLSAVPYKLNEYLTDLAILTSTNMVDLGGHTQNVIKQLSRTDEAEKKGISIVPDCGMGPGMNISMALLAMEQLEKTDHVYVWDGGLPIEPKAPWNYNLFFNIEGLTNEYDGNAFFLRDGKITEVGCFEDLEVIDFGDCIGSLEATVTSGGLSTMPWTFENKISTLENKTLRYKGHWKEMMAYRQLGLFSESAIDFNGKKIIPREFYHHLLEPMLDDGRVDDVCIMRTEAYGEIKNQKVNFRVECIEQYDHSLDISAMEKWTGWHASMMMAHIMAGKVKKGAVSVENAMTGQDFYNYALSRGYKIKISEI